MGSSDIKILEDAVRQSVQTIRSASSLAAQDIPFSRTLSPDLSQHLDVTSDRLQKLAGEMLQLVSNSKNTPGSSESTASRNDWKGYANKLDNIFEVVEHMFDRLNSQDPNIGAKEKMLHLDSEVHDMEATNALSRSRIVKPQQFFKTKVDNSELAPFKPKLSSKPHALKSFEESCNLRSGADTEFGKDPDYYPHPYEYEIDTHEYPELVLEILEPKRPKDWTSTSAIWVETEGDLSEMVSELSSQAEIAVDLEHHDYRSYYGIVCLMQISSREKDWIIDTLKLRDSLVVLNEIFANPNIVKVFHGAFMDIIWLQRDLGLYVVSLFDTYHASKKLGLPRFSLAYLLENYANFKTSKKYQLADWRMRPLLGPMLSYARSDTHFLLYVYDQLRNQLLSSGNQKMKEVLHESRQVAKRRFEFTKYRPYLVSGSKVSCPVMAPNAKEPYSTIMNQFNLPNHTRPIVEALYFWREAKAKECDELVRYIMPNQLLVNFSLLALPVDKDMILRNPYITDLVRNSVDELVTLLNSIMQQVSDSDWALVDNWHGSSEGKILSSEESLGAQKIASVFETAVSEHTKSLQKAFEFAKGSRLLGEEDLGNVCAISFDLRNRQPVYHLDSEFRERTRKLESKLTNYSAPIREPGIVQSEQDDTQDDHLEKAAIKNIVAPQKLFDNDDEIISLRKRTPNRNVEAKNDPQTDVLNYSGSTILGQVKGTTKKDKKTKRSFDPNSVDDHGPQPAKRARRMNQGKSLTFSSQKKR